MPLYEYQCTKCRHVCEVLQKAKDKPPQQCPKCGGPVLKLVSSPAIQFKGKGWYITDYAKKSPEPERTKAAVESGPKAAAGPSSGEAAKDKPDKSSP